ncbi:putative protein of unknown function (DUF383) [Trypanosoma vivax]|uniref:Uncharacterized protein n=1 Tax=Trypanosoma vivax (strain Y486) TaxID=1055687 RepID=G0UAI3_TRYVY|nr:putative protein of unknown function (DUF383) [Trypanosoma vivax]CCC52816.1 conserved hypothetical protein [Trypanosoma vivax Y486]
MGENNFVEVFEFLSNVREDVRKMAAQGLAQHSKDNTELFDFLASSKHGPKCIDLLLQYMHAGAVQLLGDVLTILINCSANSTCVEALVAHKIVRKAMRLLDSLEASDHPTSLQRGLEEMTLMLLSNLTASHVTAADDLLQVADEDLRGFYVGKLHTYFSRFASSGGDEQEKREKDADEGTGGDEDHRKVDFSKQAPARDLQKWVLQILHNLTRTMDGQKLLMGDEDWVATLTVSLSSPNPRHRLLAAQCYRNCSFLREQHGGLVRGGCIRACVERLCTGSERSGDVERLLAEIVTNVMESEVGMECLDELNAKKHLEAAAASGKMSADTSEFIVHHVLPHLDDVVDAYVMNDGDEVD